MAFFLAPLALLLERESTTRRQKRFEARARAAMLRHDAQVEDADFRAERGLDRSLFLKGAFPERLPVFPVFSAEFPVIYSGKH